MLSKLKAIYEAVIGFFDLVVTLVEFVFGLVKDLLKVIAMLIETVARLPGYLGMFFPSAFVAIFVAIISVVVIYKTVGREG